MRKRIIQTSKNMTKKIFRFGYGDPFGENTPDSIFNDEILPMLKKSGMSDEDINTISFKIDNMLSKAFLNGQETESFNERYD